MVNAVEDCVASESDNASQGRSTPAAPVAGVTARSMEKRTERSFEGRLLSRLLTFLGDPALEFVLWTGESVRPAIVAEPVAQLRIADRAALYGLLADPQVSFGESYSQGRIGVEGDLVGVLEVVYRASLGAKRRFSVLRRGVEMMRRRRVNTLHGSRDNIHHHYDIGNKFYSLWLGRTMAYTCAYYPTSTTSLDDAQVAKMDHVCRKMRLKPGESVVEAGCGWGSLAIHTTASKSARSTSRKSR
jgi:cyclopropane-fatty-acyl-phospholipid synthase